jgi:HAD superfamily hydrolase (TIGR01509 family)
VQTPFPSIRAVVFDLDGLMLNTEDIFDHAGRELMQRRGMEMSEEIHHQMLGRRPHEAFQILKDMTGIQDEITDLMHETREIFDAYAAHHLDTMPGLFELLEMIETRATPKAVATSSPRSYMTTLLSRFDLLQRFVTTLTAEDVTHGKPNPEIYLTAAARLDVHPSEMLVLEDSETGTRAAAAAGAFAVSVPNRHTACQDFSASSLRVQSLADPALIRIFD